MNARRGFGSEHPRFPGFDVLGQAGAWDEVTREVVLARLHPNEEPRFFTTDEFLTAAAMLDQLVGQDGDRLVPVAAMIDDRLAENSTDGWHYADMPSDKDVWRMSLHALDDDARVTHDLAYAGCPPITQRALLQAVQDLGSETWHDLDAAHVWNMWTRYASTAFYSHPAAWNEIGFSGPAYPRGYKNAHVGTREPFEVADAMPQDDPLRGRS